MPRQSNPTAFQAVTREMVSEIKTSVSEINVRIEKLDDKVTILFNHQSTRLPFWASAVLTTLAAACGFLLRMVIGGS